MTPRDAINLLLAAAGSSRVKFSIRPVEQHGACRSKEGAWKLSFQGLPELRVLRAEHTFADTLEALLHATLNGSVNPRSGDLNLSSLSGEHRPQTLGVQVRIREPFALADITVGIRDFGQDHEAILTNDTKRNYQIDLEADGSFHPPFDGSSLGDLTHIHEFTEKAIYRIAQEFLGT